MSHGKIYRLMSLLGVWLWLSPAVWALSSFEILQQQLQTDEAVLPAEAAGGSAAARVESHAEVLSVQDKALYRDIFHMQQNGAMRQADQKIAQLDNRLLLGHVLYQRYMHPTAYRSSYQELRDWLYHYADHPGAQKIYTMAGRRGSIYGVRRPESPRLPEFLSQSDEDAFEPPADGKRRPRWRHYEYRVYKDIVGHIRKERPSYAYDYLEQNRHRMSPYAAARALAQIAKGYFLYGGLDDKVIAAAQDGLAQDTIVGPDLHWWAGVAHWREAQYLHAAHHFRAIAFAPNVDADKAARASLWAARALMRTDFMEEASELLQMASEHSFSFYGQLASEMLGDEVSYRWDWSWDDSENEISDAHYFDYPAAKRALALYQLGDIVRSGKEFRRIITQLPPNHASHYVGYINRSDLASVALAFGRKLNQDYGVRMNSALYPLPRWQPEDGFRLEPALIFGFIRQESTFKPNALSRDGASGLMQLMPATARFISRGKRVRRDKLFQPEYNMALGQRYIESLMRERYINHNLLFTAVAYNGGPGNFRRWQKKTDYRDDPLLYLETIPSYESRHFARAVLLNYWIYADRLGTEALSRRQLARGEWPVYGRDDAPERKPVVRKAAY